MTAAKENAFVEEIANSETEIYEGSSEANGSFDFHEGYADGPEYRSTIKSEVEVD